MINDKKWLILSAQEISLAVGPDRQVLLHLDLSQSAVDLGLQVEIGLHLSAADSRALAHALIRKADEAEA